MLQPGAAGGDSAHNLRVPSRPTRFDGTNRRKPSRHDHLALFYLQKGRNSTRFATFPVAPRHRICPGRRPESDSLRWGANIAGSVGRRHLGGETGRGGV